MVLTRMVMLFMASTILRFGATLTVSPYMCRHSAVVAAAASSNSRLHMSSTAEAPVAKTKKKKRELIPMTLLSGFLGSGKTTTLKHLLENTEGLKVGVIVNDVASVNIDAKLVSSSTEDMVELENGCACCSLADELLTSVETLLIRRRKKEKQMKNKSQGNNNNNFDAIVIELSGVADPMSIKSNWKTATAQGHPVTKHTTVDRVVTLVDASTFGTDWMTSDLAQNRDTWGIDACGAERKVTELLAEQVEAAQVVVLNKLDLASDEEATIAKAVAAGINPEAVVESVEFGKIPSNLILGALEKKEKEEEKKEHKSCCGVSACGSNKNTSSHSHSHDHDAEEKKEDDDDCADADCTDTTHSHSHTEHSHSHVADMDIVNFVYKRDVPFHTVRLLTLLNFWPIPIKENLELGDFEKPPPSNDDDDSSSVSPFTGVLRSKGFCWMAPQKWMGPTEDSYRHDTAMYWSHAGKHLGIESAGKWWGTITPEKMKPYFKNNPEEMERILKEDFVSEEWKDRRQELVFIGSNIDEEAITEALDKCLLTKIEMKRYREDAANHVQLQKNLAEQAAGEIRNTADLFEGIDDFNPTR